MGPERITAPMGQGCPSQTSALGALCIGAYPVWGRGLEAETVARATLDDLELDDQGRYSLTIGGEEREAEGQWLAAPKGSNMIWVRHMYDDRDQQAHGRCTISRLDPVPPPPSICPSARFSKFVARLRLLSPAGTIESLIQVSMLAYASARRIGRAKSALRLLRVELQRYLGRWPSRCRYRIAL